MLNSYELRQWSRQVHTSMARAIHPFHTTGDGDVLFAVTTGERAQRVDVDELGAHAAGLLWDAIIGAVTASRSTAGHEPDRSAGSID
jgi:L-aminopeptidase/D-esterase-like protein